MAADPEAIKATSLGNGIRLVTERMPDVRSVALGFWVDVGSRDEAPELAGVSHFLEHLLFKGTEQRTARHIAESVEAVGGEMNAFTTKEYTAFYTRLLDEDLDLGLDILCDILSSPAFRPDEVESERQVILEEILMHEDEPSELVHDLFTEALFPNHPVGREVLGSAESISALSRDAIAGHFLAHYRPPNLILAGAGNLHHDELAAGIERRMSPVPGQRPSRGGLELSPPRRQVVCTRTTEQANVVVGMRALSRRDDDRFALSVLNQVLGGGMSSRLFQEIREQRGLVYAVYSYRSAYVESGALAVYAGTAPSHTEEVLRLIGDELDRLLQDGVTDYELALAKGHLKGSLALALEDSGGRMNRIGRSELVHGEVLSVSELVERTEAVTLDDVRRVAERVLGNERVVALVGPFEEAALTEMALTSTAATP
ncbi:MAG TPA: pitrilysin family protein [Acidimicrobiales bacterium]|nr:pitrilysin family protein [Acidimicrobiales bacterium]